MKLLSWVRQLFWRWLPHRCRFDVAEKVEHGFRRRGYRCRRCGNAVWFYVKG